MGRRLHTTHMKKFKLFIKVLLFTGLVVGGLYLYLTNKETQSVTYQVKEKVEVKLSGVDEVKNREAFKKQMEMEAKRIYLQEEKSRIQKEYDAKLGEVEKQLEGIRKEEMSFQ